LYVKPSATGTGDCSSWADACDLNTALSSITPPGEIWVAAGTYDGPIALASGVDIYGGFPATGGAWDTRDWEINVTTLTGNDSTRVVTANAVDNTAILDGFTITDGYHDSSGGGIILEDSSPALSNLHITSNKTPPGFGDGGGCG
jgi:hypothetical protein